MKRFWIGFGVGIAATVVGVMLLWAVAFLLGSFGIGGLHYVGSGHAPSAQQTNSAGNLSVTFGGELGRQVVFSRANDTFTFTPAGSESCEDAIVSPDGKTALLLMRTVLDFGYDYACVMRFVFRRRTTRSGTIPARPDPPGTEHFSRRQSVVGQ